MNHTIEYTSAPDVRQALVPEAFELPEGIYRPQAEKFREALTHLYETRLLFRMAGDHVVGNPNPDRDAEDLAHFTYEELYRKPTFGTPLTGTLEENAVAIRSWVRRAMEHNAIDLGRRRQSHKEYVELEQKLQSAGTRWSNGERRRSANPLEDYFARNSRGGNAAHAKAAVAELNLRWPHSIAVLMRVDGYDEPMTKVAKDYGVAARTIRDRIANTRAALRAYMEWERTHGGLDKNAALVAAVDAMEQLWTKKAK
jgi:DNA-directed RNA polymerase specialized sigma24 family protein